MSCLLFVSIVRLLVFYLAVLRSLLVATLFLPEVDLVKREVMSVMNIRKEMTGRQRDRSRFLLCFFSCL